MIKLLYFVFLFQCIIGDGEAVINVEMRTSCMLDQLQQQRNNLGRVKLIIASFQKKESFIITSDDSVIELDIEVC